MPLHSPLTAWRRLRTLADHRIRSLPVVVLMPHSRCNCRCVMCDIWQANARKHELTLADLEPHLEALQAWRVEWVVLSGGEALMHPNLFTLCEALRASLEARISLLSTGLLLAKHAENVTRWCDEVIVSLDGPPDVHDAIRNVPRAFEKLAAGVAALRAQAPGYPVTARCVVQRSNFRALSETVAAARDLGLDRLSFLAADVSSEAFNRPGGWDAERVGGVALDPDEAAALPDEIERCLRERADDVAAGFIVESPERLRDIGRYSLALHRAAENGTPAAETPFPPVRCNAPWTSTVIEADGTVRPCFFHPPFGNLGDRPLDALLNSDEAIAWRRALDLKRDPICQRCVCTLHVHPLRALGGATRDPAHDRS